METVASTRVYNPGHVRGLTKAFEVAEDRVYLLLRAFWANAFL